MLSIQKFTVLPKLTAFTLKLYWYPSISPSTCASNTIKLDYLIKLGEEAFYKKRDNSGVEETTFARICPSLFSRTSAMVNTFPFTNSVILFSRTSSW